MNDPEILKYLRELRAEYEDDPAWENGGFCRETSHRIAAYLRVTTGTGEAIHGELKGQPHYWVEWNGKIIDITGDFFNFIGEPLAPITIGTYAEFPDYKPEP